jgi:protein TonB
MIAMTLKLTGAVKLLVKVEVDGRVGDVKVTRSANPSLDEAARSAAYSWTYKPAKRGAFPVATWVEETVEFKLK